MLWTFTLTCVFLLMSCGARAQSTVAVPGPAPDWTSGLQAEVSVLGKTSWRPVLEHDVEMHRLSTHAATAPSAHSLDHTGRANDNGPGFGQWDVVHEVLDVLPLAPEHARDELLKDVRQQLPSGFLPGFNRMRTQTSGDGVAIYGPPGERYSSTQTNPPLWVVAADDYMTDTGDGSLMPEFLDHLTRQIGWFERERRAKPDGFFYLDVVNGKPEVGVDDGVRFDGLGKGRALRSNACVDATAQVYQMYVYAAKWSASLRRDPRPFERRADDLRRFMQTRLWSERDGFFYDSWVLEAFPDGPRERWNGTLTPGRTHSFEGMWPMVVGAAEEPQGRRVIDDWLMRGDRFFTPHPIAAVAVSDAKFEPSMWRGPAWNSMTYWAARGCVRYGRRDDANRLIEAALDDTAVQFARTGIVWEFYDAMGGPPENLKRKPETNRDRPFAEDPGQNPLIAMARLWEQTRVR